MIITIVIMTNFLRKTSAKVVDGMNLTMDGVLSAVQMVAGIRLAQRIVTGVLMMVNAMSYKETNNTAFKRDGCAAP